MKSFKVSLPAEKVQEAISIWPSEIKAERYMNPRNRIKPAKPTNSQRRNYGRIRNNNYNNNNNSSNNQNNNHRNSSNNSNNSNHSQNRPNWYSRNNRQQPFQAMYDQEPHPNTQYYRSQEAPRYSQSTYTHWNDYRDSEWPRQLPYPYYR